MTVVSTPLLSRPLDAAGVGVRQRAPGKTPHGSAIDRAGT
jgi:hypothetical protein